MMHEIAYHNEPYIYIRDQFDQEKKGEEEEKDTTIEHYYSRLSIFEIANFPMFSF